MEELYKKLAEILEADEVKREDELKQFEAWDSLGVLSVIAMADAKYRVTVTSADIMKIKTAGDLEDLIKARQPQ